MRTWGQRIIWVQSRLLRSLRDHSLIVVNSCSSVISLPRGHDIATATTATSRRRRHDPDTSTTAAALTGWTRSGSRISSSDDTALCLVNAGGSYAAWTHMTWRWRRKTSTTRKGTNYRHWGQTPQLPLAGCGTTRALIHQQSTPSPWWRRWRHQRLPVRSRRVAWRCRASSSTRTSTVLLHRHYRRPFRGTEVGRSPM